jgi:uncharacterized protein (DUF433 family)
MAILGREFQPSVAETAFIAGISDRDANRVIDEGLLPEELFIKEARGRRFRALGCALASFYFQEEQWLTKKGRELVIWSFVTKWRRHEAFAKVLDLDLTVNTVDWVVTINSLNVELAQYVAQAKQRIESVVEAGSMVTTDPEILAGEAVFKGTRVPVRTIAAWVEEGIDNKVIQEAYPSVTDDMIRVAPIYAKTNPRRGRPRRFEDLNKDWALKATARVKLTGR